MTTKQAVVTVHGAFSSQHAFDFLTNELDDVAEFYPFEYNWNASHRSIADQLVEHVNNIDNDVTIIGHSLGGNIAVLATRSSKVARVVTISSPFGGSRAANFLKNINPNAAVLHHISTTSSDVQELKKFTPTVPVYSLVTSRDVGLFQYEPSDGVVTVASQTALQYPRYFNLKFGHAEVLRAKETTELIKHILTTLP